MLILKPPVSGHITDTLYNLLIPISTWALKGIDKGYTPVWFMRQAGRFNA